MAAANLHARLHAATLQGEVTAKLHDCRTAQHQMITLVTARNYPERIALPPVVSSSVSAPTPTIRTGLFGLWIDVRDRRIQCAFWLRYRCAGPLHECHKSFSHCIGTARTETSTCSPVGSSALPIKPPDIGSACPASLVTPTRTRFAPATRPFVGSYSTQPAPGR